MLFVKLKMEAVSGTTEFEAEIWNSSNLAAMSTYDFQFEDRITTGQLTEYPRWCESVQGLVARCLALTKPEKIEQPQAWIEVQVDIFLQHGGRGSKKNLAIAKLRANEDGTVNINSSEIGIKKFIASLPMRANYEDPWSLAEHALRASVFDDDILPPAKTIELPVFMSGTTPYIRIRDIPEPTRSVFDDRMKYSGAPCVAGARDAIFEWDWLDFLEGSR